jgi:hypothetical protein
MLSERPSVSDATSPQWRIIEQITVAEVLLADGDVATAEAALHDAVADAERYRLPHQLQRVLRAFEGRASDIVAGASAALQRLTTPPPAEV